MLPAAEPEPLPLCQDDDPLLTVDLGGTVHKDVTQLIEDGSWLSDDDSEMLQVVLGLGDDDEADCSGGMSEYPPRSLGGTGRQGNSSDTTGSLCAEHLQLPVRFRTSAHALTSRLPGSSSFFAAINGVRHVPARQITRLHL